jgi:UDP-N-acetylmuramoyl-tripeptide--D-alanyl-D-alanine ligase
VVTGSNGKTTLLHMLESQIGDKAKYSHHANTSFGIPFDILDLHRKILKSEGWISFFFLAPFRIFLKLPKEKIYIVEADAYSSNVGKFLAELLRPEIVLWVSTARTHSMNFDSLVADGKFKNVEEAIAYEYGYFLEYSSKFAIINGDSELQLQQKSRTKADVRTVTKEKDFKKFTITKEGTTFELVNKRYTFPYLLPEEIFYSIAMCKEVVEYLNLTFDSTFKNFSIPPGRGTLFAGIKNTTLIDSSYNANLSSMIVVLEMYKKFPSNNKWVVLGDMLELGEEEKEEHEKFAEVVLDADLENVILVGRLTKKYTYPILKGKQKVASFESGREALDYLEKNLKGSESVLFKGSQSLLLESIIKKLLKNESDVSKLPRQGQFWDDLRKRKGY